MNAAGATHPDPGPGGCKVWGPCGKLGWVSQSRIIQTIAAELSVAGASVAPWQVKAAVELLDAGSTVPFIARYRKEVTGTLDDTQLRMLEERLRYLRELEERRATILKAIDEAGKLTEELATVIGAATTKAELEDLYLPYKSKRRTKAQIAREAGLEPLADSLIADPSQDPETLGAAFLSPEHEINAASEALAGARAILTERASQDAVLVSELRERLWTRGKIASRTMAGAPAAEAAKFSDYEDFVQPVATQPSHRILALLRGEREGVLNLELAEADPRDDAGLAEARATYEAAVAKSLGITAAADAPAGKWLAQTVRLAWRGRLLARLESDLRTRLFEAAEEASVKVFAANLRDVLLAAPAGNRAVLGLDPGLRTGVKVAVVDATGKVVDIATIYPHAPANKWSQSVDTLVALAAKHGTELIAVGNGTASRETDKLAGEVITKLTNKPAKVIVSEAGASVYSASALASAELPDLDVSIRGAVSIARRLQDPLAELVKIEPKSIGVGQYQHDLTPAKLDRSLDAVVEDCVNAVGVDVNTASPALLARVAGVGSLLSRNIVEHRNTNGPFISRKALLKVPRLGAKAFEQCAGFLRITGGKQPLDASAVHPEAYGLAEALLKAATAANTSVGSLNATDFVTEQFGLPTVKDVIAELVRPARDPRPDFKTANLKEGVEKIGDLEVGMILEGTVSNVAAFGAFVDVGVHQDGLVHVSAMSNKFISDPREIVTSGQVVKVKVLEVDPARKRISLTLRLDDEPGAKAEKVERGPRGPRQTPTKQRGAKPAATPVAKAAGGHTAMAEALRRAGLSG
ncbi:Tex family protein [Paeniglutamicibacter gangotriensis]|uniref:Transcriptional accessory protein n=2 Tax=Paeniglutamicibacter gangotriensis TaxID=254787 RepID=M7N9S0_9MICC|nr:transcriptional accessory protein [Paeniglutamicibacter gangotriensis Lz1y]KAA0975221.1 RNA-binding transcriptional accessory protein [Paeniglutamicibacter gangotriensis]